MNRERGRPRNFETDEALDQALTVFWRHGFQGASLQDLTQAMGLSKPSLYAAFGDKEALYLKCLNRYVERLVEGNSGILNSEKNVVVAIEKLLRTIATLVCDPSLPGGCFIVTGTSGCGNVNTPALVEQGLRSAILENEALLLQRLVRAKKEKQLPEKTNVESLAIFFSTTITGLSVMAKSGTSLEKANRVIDMAMLAMPVK